MSDVQTTSNGWAEFWPLLRSSYREIRRFLAARTSRVSMPEPDCEGRNIEQMMKDARFALVVVHQLTEVRSAESITVRNALSDWLNAAELAARYSDKPTLGYREITSGAVKLLSETLRLLRILDTDQK